MKRREAPPGAAGWAPAGRCRRAVAPHSPALSPRLGSGGGRGTVRGGRGDGRLLARTRGWARAHVPPAAAAATCRRHRTAPGYAAFPWRPHHRDADTAGRAALSGHVTVTSVTSIRSGPCRSRCRPLRSSPTAARAMGSALRPLPVPPVQFSSSRASSPPRCSSSGSGSRCWRMALRACASVMSR